MKRLLEILRERGYAEDRLCRIKAALELAQEGVKAKEPPADIVAAFVEAAVNDALAGICGPECEIKESFWDTSSGQLVATAQYWLYQDDLITASEAAKILFGNSSERFLMAVRHLSISGELPRYRRPDILLSRPPRRDVTGRSSRSWLYRKSEVEALRPLDR